jgi:hypothetical protein
MATGMRQKFSFSFQTVGLTRKYVVKNFLGSSLDYWHDVKKTGESLRQSGAKVFVATTRLISFPYLIEPSFSSEINFDEMLVYAGDSRNIFIGARDKMYLFFSLSCNSLILDCQSPSVP